MKIKKILYGLITGAFLALGASGAQAATISLVPLSGPVSQGGQETFNLVANFGTQSVLAGYTDFSWDSSVLTFANFSFSAAMASPVRDPLFDAKTIPASSETFDLQSSSLVTIGFGNFSGLSLSSDTIIGTLTFNAVGAPGSSTLINLSDSLKWDGYFDAVSFNQIPVTYTGVTANVSAVPLPAAAWLFGSGLLGLLGLARRKAAT